MYSIRIKVKRYVQKLSKEWVSIYNLICSAPFASVYNLKLYVKGKNPKQKSQNCDVLLLLRFYIFLITLRFHAFNMVLYVKKPGITVTPSFQIVNVHPPTHRIMSLKNGDL